jgi:hypothetical protein
VVSEIATNARQAREFYNATQRIPMLSKPILLYYPFEKLANMLILMTFEIKEDTFNHGLRYHNGNIMVQSKGLFQRFHDCYSFNPEIYTKKYIFRFNDLIKAGPTNEDKLFQIMKDGSISSNKIIEEKSGHEITLHELDRQFLFVYGLSVLSRYRVNEWNELLAGKYSKLVIDIKRYLQSIQLFFPNLLLNSIYEKIFLFYSFARVGAG